MTPVFVLLIVSTLSCVTAQNAAASASATIVATPEMMVKESAWRQQLREAVAGASDRFQVNFLSVLGGLGNTTADAGQNVTRAFATLTRAVVTNTLDLGGVVAYMPKLLLMDLPNQFTEVLQLIRRNEIRVIPSDVNSAIDTILVMTKQAEQSGITRKIFDPIVKFVPNLMAGIHDFLQTIIGTTANVFGAGLYRFDPEIDQYISANTKPVY